MPLNHLTRHTLSAAALALPLALVAAPASAQTFYLPVQFQFGRYGQIYYGGDSAHMLQRLVGVSTDSLASRLLGGNAGPHTVVQLSRTLDLTDPGYHLSALADAPMDPLHPLIYSDLEPYSEVGSQGFTVADARHEAYLNVPRYQTKANLPEASNDRPLARPSTARHAEQDHATAPERALPLLDWARHLHATGENPKLLAAVLQQAHKLDPSAVTKLRDGWHRG